MSEFVMIAVTTIFAVAVFVGISLLTWYLITKPRETGPWVVTRVAVGGGMEFWDFKHPRTGEQFWTKDPKRCPVFHDHEFAIKRAEELTADVHPLSRYVGGVR